MRTMRVAVIYKQGNTITGSLVVGTGDSFFIARNLMTGEVIEKFYPSRLTTIQKDYAPFFEGLGEPVTLESKRPFMSLDYLPQRDLWVIGYSIKHGTEIIADKVSARGTWRKRIRSISASQQTLQVWRQCHQEVLTRIDGIREAVEIVSPFYKCEKKAKGERKGAIL